MEKEYRVCNEMLVKVLNAFPLAIVRRDDIIIYPKMNSCFLHNNIKSDLQFKCKILECLSRPSFKGGYYKSHNHNIEIYDYHLNGINKVLGTNFTREQIEEIYNPIGNGINRKLCIEFIESNYNFDLLKERK